MNRFFSLITSLAAAFINFFLPEFVVLLPTQFCCKNCVGYVIVSDVRHGIVSKGNKTEDAGWSENTKMCTFHLHASFGCCVKMDTKEVSPFLGGGRGVGVNLELLGHGYVGSLFISPFPLAY